MSCRLLIDYCCVLVRAGFLTNVDVVIIFCDLRLFNNFFCFCKCHRKFRNVEICQKISLVLVLLLEECVPEKWCRKISQYVLQIFHYSLVEKKLIHYYYYSYFDGKFRWFFFCNYHINNFWSMYVCSLFTIFRLPSRTLYFSYEFDE